LQTWIKKKVRLVDFGTVYTAPVAEPGSSEVTHLSKWEVLASLLPSSAVVPGSPTRSFTLHNNSQQALVLQPRADVSVHCTWGQRWDANGSPVAQTQEVFLRKKREKKKKEKRKRKKEWRGERFLCVYVRGRETEKWRKRRDGFGKNRKKILLIFFFLSVLSFLVWFGLVWLQTSLQKTQCSCENHDHTALPHNGWDTQPCGELVHLPAGWRVSACLTCLLDVPA
jgi:hypothetical protein